MRVSNPSREMRAIEESLGWSADSAQPQGYCCSQSDPARERGRQFFVVRAFIIIEIVLQSLSPASLGSSRNRPLYLGFRAVVLHPRLALCSPAPQAENVKSCFAQKFG